MVWQTIGAAVARILIWHFIIVAHNTPLVEGYATQLGTQ